MSKPEVIRFSDLALSAPILQAVEEVGYETPSPIQAESIPPLLEGRDLLGMAQTGTGKTAAFALPLLSKLDISIKQPQILVLAPTRELAIQVAEAMQTYARHIPGFHILPVYGGQGMDQQLRQLKRGVHVVVGTPGRIQDHLRRKTLKLDQIRAVVLDEADEMLRMGFIEDVEEILQHTPEDKQVALFSATMPDQIKRVASHHLHDPVEIRIAAKTATVSTISQRYWQVTGMHKLDALTRILEVEDFDGMIIFVRTKNATVELAEKLEARGYSAAALNGDMNQSAREKTVERLKKSSLDILIATDVAARGLDVERISHVVNFDIPYDTEAYIHRIGRTGRAGRKGEAILFVSPRERRMLYAIEKATKQKISPMQLPSREAVTDKRVMQFKQGISDALESQELAFFEELVENYAAEHNVGMSEVGAALAFLLQRDKPLVPEQNAIDSGMAQAQDRPPREKRRDYRERDEREPRSERSSRRRDQGEDRDSKRREHNDENMVTYRIEVGRDHGAQPKNIVGAIANEAGIDSAFIGHIKLYDDFSTVDLPDGMPEDVFQHLQQVRVCGRPLQLRLQRETLKLNARKPRREDRERKDYDRPRQDHDRRPRKHHGGEHNSSGKGGKGKPQKRKTGR